MELWIRSQDSECLTKISNVEYNFINDLHIIGTYYDNLRILGIYETKERALEILDEIQSAIEHDGKSYYDKKEDALYNLFGVYEMPKE